MPNALYFALSLGIGIMLLGVVSWFNPLWFYQLGHRWLLFTGRSMMSLERRRDAELLLSDPEQWAARHSSVVRHARLTLGVGAFLFGLLWTALTLVAMRVPPSG